MLYSALPTVIAPRPCHAFAQARTSSGVDAGSLYSKIRVACAGKPGGAIGLLKAHEAELRRMGVLHLYLFGSTARCEAREDSDVDLFFDHPEGSLGLFALMDVKEAATRILARKTDIMTRRSLHPVLRKQIEASALQVF